MPEHDILTIEEVADYLRVSERTVYDWANKGTIPCGKLGTTWRFKRAEVEKWVDERLSGNRSTPRQRTTPKPPSVSIADILSVERVIILDTDKKEVALNSLIDCLARAEEVDSREALVDEIFKREALMSTGIGFNVAVPHVRLDSVSELVMAMGLSHKDIVDYESLDESPVRIICMIAARSDQHAQYLKTLGAMSSVLKADSIREALLDAKTPQEAFDILTLQKAAS